MTEALPTQKVDPETLVLRGQPKRVVRFKRNVLIGAAAIGCFAVIGVTWAGLQPPKAMTVEEKNLYDPDKRSSTPNLKPERLQALPASYGEVPANVPKLGPPLPGDLGGPMLEHQRESGYVPAAYPTSPNIQTDSARASGVFFQVAKTGEGAAPVSASGSDLTGNGPLEPALIKAGYSPDGDKDQNAQGRKRDFMESKSSKGIYNLHSLQSPVSPYQVMAGSIISASLITGLNSDLPGFVIAQVTESVFDSVTGRVLLIPQGTRLIGEYDSVVAFGQSRALLVWKRLILPDGSSLEIDNLPATDSSGYAGLSDKVDYHTWSLIKGVGLSTLLGISALQDTNEDSDLVRALRDSVQQTANQAGQRIVEKSLNIQPSIKVRPGWPLRVIVHKDLILKPYKP